MACSSAYPLRTNRFTHHYHLGETTFIFYLNFLYADRIAPDMMPHIVASRLGLYCLPMSKKRTPGINK